MARRRAKATTASKKRNAGRQNVLDIISPEDALSVLRCLAKEDKSVARRIEQIVMALHDEVEVSAVAADVQSDLAFLDVEEVWQRSRSNRDEYVEPVTAAWEMMEEALVPFQKELQKYHRLGMINQARSYCMGILKGIYDFDKDSKTEYKDWAQDGPEEFFGRVLEDWKKTCGMREEGEKLRAFIERNCPDWA